MSSLLFEKDKIDKLLTRSTGKKNGDGIRKADEGSPDNGHNDSTEGRTPCKNPAFSALKRLKQEGGI